MKFKNSILIIDDDISLCDTLSDILTMEGHNVRYVIHGDQAIELIQNDGIDIVLLDLLLPGLDGIQVLQRILKIDPEIAVIMISGFGTIEKAVEAVHLGAYEWMEKPLKKDKVISTIQNVARIRNLILEKRNFSKEAYERFTMVGSSPAMQKIYATIEKVAKQNIPVLITGESGTGKELVARAIHQNSDRGSFPFVEVNCAAIPDTLIESELFGHVKGSYTGAFQDTRGKFQKANHGTMLLDEVGDLSLAAQAKILRTIETRICTRVGGNTEEECDVRVICATNKILKNEMAIGHFREDLFHRINGIDIHIPPLRERPDDIVPIARYYIEFFCSEMHIQEKKLSPKAEGALLAHSWPGNIRELKNFIEKLLVLMDGPTITGNQVLSLLSSTHIEDDEKGSKKLNSAKKDFEKSFILQALNSNRWNVTKTAEMIEIPRSLLYRKIKSYGLKRE